MLALGLVLHIVSRGQAPTGTDVIVQVVLFVVGTGVVLIGVGLLIRGRRYRGRWFPTPTAPHSRSLIRATKIAAPAAVVFVVIGLFHQDPLVADSLQLLGFLMAAGWWMRWQQMLVPDAPAISSTTPEPTTGRAPATAISEPESYES